MHFWKYVSCFRKNDNNPIELEIDGNRLYQLCEVAEALAAYCISSVFNNQGTHEFSTFSHLVPYPEHLSVTQTLSRMQGAYPHQNLLDLTTLDDTPACIINGCSGMFLTHCGRVTQICVFTLQLCRTGDADLRF